MIENGNAKKELNKVNESLAEATETQAWLDYALDCGYVTRAEHKNLDAGWQTVGGKLRQMIIKAESFLPQRTVISGAEMIDDRGSKMDAPSSVLDPPFSIVYPPSSIFHPRSSIVTRGTRALALVLIVAGAVAEAHAAKIGDLSTSTIGAQLARFLSLGDPVVRAAITGSVLLGISCGLLGSFLVVRKLALAGDALAHAVLPGVALGFMWNMTKDPIAIFIGAVGAGLLGILSVSWIKDTTHIKEDSSLGLVLGGFYAIGIALITRVLNAPGGNQSGLDKFLFGQAAALSTQDLVLMAGVAALVVVLVVALYKELVAASFDPGFARAAGLPVRGLQVLLMLLLAFAVVTALQAVGAVLVSALLITPAAAAYLLTDRMPRMLTLSATFGVAAGLLGSFFSFLGNNLPTGPFMVLAASTVFLAAFLFGPRHGVLPRWWRRRSRREKVRDENTLKAIYHVREQEGFTREGVALEALAQRLNESPEETRSRVDAIARRGLGSISAENGRAYLNPDGWLHACAVVRNHRLWELYLTHSADYSADHVHDDAEVIEHVLGEETVRKLERLLDFPAEDPHGKLIPSLTDLQRSLSVHPERPAPTGYRQPTP